MLVIGLLVSLGSEIWSWARRLKAAASMKNTSNISTMLMSGTTPSLSLLLLSEGVTSTRLFVVLLCWWALAF